MDGCIVLHRQRPLFSRGMADRLEAAHPSPPPQAGGEGKRILIADDSELVRKIIRRFLETAGFMVCSEAMDGGDAVKKATQLKPDLIVLDLTMPDMNGIEAASVLKGLMPHVPIIMFSMHSNCLGQALVSALGVKAVISKADGVDKLIDCVRNLLRPRAPSATEQLTSGVSANESADSPANTRTSPRESLVDRS